MQPIAVGQDKGIKVPRKFEKENRGWTITVRRDPKADKHSTKPIKSLYTQEQAEVVMYANRFEYMEKGVKKVNYTNPNYDYYTTINPMSRPNKWGADNVLGINTVFVDIDLRDKNSKTRENADTIFKLAQELQEYLSEGLQKNGVPIPTEAVSSGSGLQLAYHIKQVPYQEPFITIHRNRTLGLLEELSEIIRENPKFNALYEVDKEPSINVAGLRRALVGYNQKTGNRPTLLEYNETNYTIDTFKPYEKPIKKANKKTTSKAKYVSKQWATNQEMPINQNTVRMLNRRLRDCYTRINMLNEKNEHEGSRYKILFTMYNILIQLNNGDHEQSFREVGEANKLFAKPLSDKELNEKLKIKEAIGYYKMTNETFYNRLGATQEELGGKPKPPNYSRNLELHKKKLQKQQRDELVVKLYNEGVIIKDIVTRVAEATGKKWSRRTINNIISKESKKGNVKKRIPKNPGKR